MKIKYIYVLMFFIQGIAAFATAQYSDYLIYNGNKFNLNANPMEVYFNRFPEKRPKPNVVSSALWRGYIATFEIIQNELWVVDIEIQVGMRRENNRFIDEWRSVIGEVFDGENRIKVDWFNGLLIIPQGRLVEYVHMGYGSLYENYILIEIENGIYIREYNLNNEQYNRYRNAQYELFRNTEAYENIFNELNNGTIPNELLDYFIKTYEIEYMTKIIEE
jgi:hypothetical protein